MHERHPEPVLSRKDSEECASAEDAVSGSSDACSYRRSLPPDTAGASTATNVMVAVLCHMLLPEL